MRKHTLIIALAGLSALGLSACSSTKESLGLNKQTPDEFMVVKNAPLSMPPDYSLRPPQPGAPRPQERAAAQAAKVTVFGAETVDSAQPTATSAEAILLQQTGSANANPNIRNVVDYESQQIESENQTVANKLLGWGSDEPGASVVNATEEVERLKKNAAEGKPVTAGETPTIEQ